MDILLGPENPSPKREFLLTAAGSEEVNGSYTRTSEDDIFYKKRYTAGDPAGVVFIITLDSLPDLGDDFEIAWVLQSHNALSHDEITYYAAPCDDPDSFAFPMKGWIAISGTEPLPRIFPRPVQLPRDRTSNLSIIEEDEEVDFSIEPFWPEDIDPAVSEEEDQDQFYGWGDFNRDDPDGDWPEGDGEYEEPSSEGEDSDYGEVELPDNIMENFIDGQFGHKAKPLENSFSDDQEREATSPRGSNLGPDIDSDTSDDPCIVRHDSIEAMFRNQSSDYSLRSSTSNQVDEKDEDQEKEEEEEKTDSLVLTAPRRMESGVAGALIESETATAEINPHLAYARSLGTRKGEITIVDLRHEPPKITGARVGCHVLRHARVASGAQDEIDFRIASPPYRPLIAPIKDPFMAAINVQSRNRRSRDHIDVDLISSVGDVSEKKSSRQKSARPGANNPEKESPARRRSHRRRGGKPPQTENNSSGTAIEENKIKKDVANATEDKQIVLEGEAKTQVSAPPPAAAAEKRDPEREKLEEEMHLLKTKMRKCDRLSKLRKRGRNLTKAQQDTLVNKSKYKQRIEELRRQLGSDIGRS